MSVPQAADPATGWCGCAPQHSRSFPVLAPPAQAAAGHLGPGGACWGWVQPLGAPVDEENHGTVARLVGPGRGGGPAGHRATVGRSAMDWRHRSTIDWRRTTGIVERVKIDDGLVLDVVYRDRHDERNRVEAFVGDASGKWVGRRVPIRYDAGDHQSVELVGYGNDDPIPALLLAGAPLGAGIAGIVLAISLFRRRALVAVSARPLQAMRGPLVAATCLVVAGVAAWAIGTVWERGWSA